MTEELKPGDEVWVRATVDDPCSDRIYVFAKDGFGARTYISVDQDDIRKSPPSEQPETAELDANLLETIEKALINHGAKQGFMLGEEEKQFAKREANAVYEAICHRVPHSRTTEFERRVVEAAIGYHEGRSSDGLDEAVEALLAVTAPPSLEEKIKAVLDEWAVMGHGSDVRPDIERRILALVKAHES